jgi:hypothetical protein
MNGRTAAIGKIMDMLGPMAIGTRTIVEMEPRDFIKELSEFPNPLSVVEVEWATRMEPKGSKIPTHKPINTISKDNVRKVLEKGREKPVKKQTAKMIINTFL